jgi:hypothetical protein
MGGSDEAPFKGWSLVTSEVKEGKQPTTQALSQAAEATKQFRSMINRANIHR